VCTTQHTFGIIKGEDSSGAVGLGQGKAAYSFCSRCSGSSPGSAPPQLRGMWKSSTPATARGVPQYLPFSSLDLQKLTTPSASADDMAWGHLLNTCPGCCRCCSFMTARPGRCSFSAL